MDEKKRQRNEKEFDFGQKRMMAKEFIGLKLLESWDGRLNI